MIISVRDLDIWEWEFVRCSKWDVEITSIHVASNKSYVLKSVEQHAINYYGKLLRVVFVRSHWSVWKVSERRHNFSWATIFGPDASRQLELQWPIPVVHQLNTTTRMPFEILFVMLMREIVSPFTLGIQCLHENEKTAKYSGSCIQQI